MGVTFSNTFKKLFGKKEMNLIMIGFPNAGKTTTLFRLKLGQVNSSVPTIGFTVETVEFKKVRFTVWDISNQEKIRLLWRHYYQDTHGIIFVVDSSDRDTIEKAKEELKGLLREEDLKSAPLLVFANKQDLGVMSVAEITAKLELSEIKGREWYIQGTCALTGEGLFDGLDWISKTVSKK